MSEQDLRERAVLRIKAKREFGRHLAIYVLVNLLLNAVWALNSFGDFYWPVWPLLGWGVGVVFHASEVHRPRRPITETEIDREIQGMSRTT